LKSRILAVDDDTVMREMLSTYLTGVGYGVDVSDGVKTTLSLIESNEYDIILLDKNMPGLDGKGHEGGMEILRHVKAQMLPAEIIMMTGYATIDNAIEAMKLGAFDYIRKPFPLKELKEKIERLLEYKSFFDSAEIIKVYRDIQGEIFNLIENKLKISNSELDEALKSLNIKIDKCFMLFKGYERLALTQRESLANIALYAEQLNTNVSDLEQYQKLVDIIMTYSGNRI
jgi:DNA-binding response OmpR family regulator